MVQNRDFFNVIGYLYGDGWITKNKRGYYTCGFSGDVDDLVEIKNILYKYSNPGKCTINTRKTVSEKYNINGTTNSFVCSPSFSKYLVDIGIHYGTRADTEVVIPGFLANATIEQKIDFIAGFYAAEGDSVLFQTNNVTPKAPAITFTKRIELEDNLFVLIRYITDTLDRLNIKYSIERKITKTCSDNVKVKIVISNSLDNMLKFLLVIGRRTILCDRKRIKNHEMLMYLLHKKIYSCRLKNGYLLAKYTKTSPTKISNTYNVSIRQVRHWRDDKKCGYKLPKKFIKFNEFKNRYCSPKTPLNRETPT